MSSPPVTAPANAAQGDAASTPLDSLWQGKVVIWVVLAGEGLAAILTLAADQAEGRWVRFGLISLLVLWVTLLTLGGLYLLRGALARLRPQRIAYIALILLLCSTWTVVALCWWLLEAVGALPDAQQDLMLRVSLIALIVGWLGLAAFQNYWRMRQLLLRAKQAELEALQARVRPHFLFNTLNTGAALVHLRPDEAEQLLLDLADLFRAALAGNREIALAEELALVRRYLEIEHLRFGERLRVRWSVPDTVPPIRVPTLSLQPLIENAIRHGIERLPGGGEVGITVTVDAQEVHIAIENPMPPRQDEHAPRGHNIGLPASLARIEAHTAGRGSVRANAVEGRFRVDVRLPLS